MSRAAIAQEVGQAARGEIYDLHYTTTLRALHRQLQLHCWDRDVLSCVTYVYIITVTVATRRANNNCNSECFASA